MSIWKSRLAAVVAAMALASPASVVASDKLGAEPLRVERSADWERLELLEDAAPFFSKEPFTETSRQDEEEIIRAFAGETEPASGRFVLHVARAPARPDPEAPPVLLVPGAVVDATTSFGRASFKGRGGVGLAAHLARSGRQVFAITFAHPHGCNWLQSEQVANAIARIRAITGAARVDVVAHSKGGVAARLYASDVRKPGMTRFRGDIRRLVLIGAPNAGIDVAFAYPNLSYWVIHNKASAPLIWTEALCYGVWTNLRERSLYAAPEGGGAFAGQAQMLRRWDDVYGLYKADPNQYDVETTYNGGRGRVSISLGIDRAIADGGNLMARLEKAGIDRRVEIAALAGTKPTLMGFTGERRGPSDGLVLVRSALATAGLASAGAKVVRRDALHLSHVELAYAPAAMRWIEEALGK